MATVVFVLDFEPGHILPTFHLTRSLEERGHRVTYVGVPDVGPYVEDQGFAFEPLLPEHYPPGSSERIRRVARERRSSNGRREASPEAAEHLRLLVRGSLDETVERLRPDLILSSYFFALETLILFYRHDIPIALFTPFLRTATQGPEKGALYHLMHSGPVAAEVARLAMERRPGIRKLDQVIAPFVEIPELVACPRELEVPGVTLGPNVRYIESCVRLEGEGTARDRHFDWDSIPSDRPLVYVSLGSQTSLYRERARRVYREVFELIRESAEEPWHYVVSLPEPFTEDELGPASPSATVRRWVPQVEILRRADAMITHGGLGSVKECIHHGVPMIVTPLHRDQPENARRITHHGLGESFTPDAVTAADLRGALRRLLDEGAYRLRLEALRAVFTERQEARIGARVVEDILARASGTA